jgi:hypothetical protein
MLFFTFSILKYDHKRLQHSQVWWYIPVIPVLRRLRQEDLRSGARGQSVLHENLSQKKKMQHEKDSVANTVY